MNKTWNTTMALPSTRKPVKRSVKQIAWERAQRHSIELNKIGFNFVNHFNGTYRLVMWLKDDESKTPFETVYFDSLRNAETYIENNYEKLKAYNR